MKKIFYIGLIAFLSLSMIGCGSCKPTLTKETKVTDSTVTSVKIVPRDTIVNVPSDSLKIKVKIDELKPTPIERKSVSGRMTAKISRPQPNDIIVQCNTDSLELQLELRDKEINTLRERLTEKKETVTVRERYTPLWKNVLAGIGILFIAIILGLVGAKFIKP